MKRALRVGVSVLALLLLLIAVDWEAALPTVQSVAPIACVFVMVTFAVQLAVSSWKWQWALRLHGLRFEYPFLTRVLVIGFFLNNFLPTSIGGDAYRVYRTIPKAPPRSAAVSAVLLERVVGLLALLLLGLVAAIVLYTQSAIARAYVMLAAIGFAGALVVCTWLALRPARSGMPALLPARWLESRWLAPVRDNLRMLRRARAGWVPLIGISLLFQAQAILIPYALFNGIGESFTLAQAALVAATAGIATVFPFSINGLGIVEATIAGTAVAVGVPYESGLVVALLMRVLLIPLTLLAGLVYALEPAGVRNLSTSPPT